jgi:hypothetical protein
MPIRVTIMVGNVRLCGIIFYISFYQYDNINLDRVGIFRLDLKNYSPDSNRRLLFFEDK